MNNLEIKKLKKMFKKVIRESSYNWITDLDILYKEEDLLQECYLKVIESRNKESIFVNEAVLSTFIRNTLKNLAKKTQTNKRKTESFVNLEDSGLDNLLFENSNSLQLAVWEVLNEYNKQTSKKEAKMLVDYYIFGYTYEDIAEMNKINNKGYVKQIIDKELTNTFLLSLLSDLKEVRYGY